MSYCVNCGVELAPSEQSCPLCGVEVLNPRAPQPEHVWRPYPQREDPAVVRSNRRFIAAILSIALALPAAICLAIDWSGGNQLSWSFYVTGGLAMAWCCAVPSFLFVRPGFFKIATPVSISIVGYLYLIERLQGDANWYFPLGLPLALLPIGLTFGVAALIVHRLIRGFTIPAVIFAASGFLTVGIDLLVNQARSGSWQISWSWFVLSPCLAIAIGNLVVARRQRVRQEILKRLHL